jgi:hypothetical protein
VVLTIFICHARVVLGGMNSRPYRLDQLLPIGQDTGRMKLGFPYYKDGIIIVKSTEGKKEDTQEEIRECK